MHAINVLTGTSRWGCSLSGFNNLKEYKKMGYLEILVALAPGMLTAVLGLVVTLWEPMKMRLKE